MSNRVVDPKLFSSIKAFLTVYLPKIRSRSEHTIKAHRDAINVFTEFMKRSKNVPLAKLRMSDFNRDNVIAYLDWIQTERGCSDSTRNQRLMSLRVFCKYLVGEKASDYDFYSEISDINRIPVPERVLKDNLTLDDIELLFCLPDAKTEHGMRDRAYIVLLYDSGCRNDEILNLKLGDIEAGKNGGKLDVIGKGRKFRVTPLSKEAIEVFWQYAARFHRDKNPEKLLFSTGKNGIETKMSPDNTARILRKYEHQAQATRADIPHLHPHLFRHVRALHLYQAGMPLAVVAEWLGHSQLETTRIYAYASTEMKKAAADKVIAAKPSIFTDEEFEFQDDEMTIKRLYGLA